LRREARTRHQSRPRRHPGRSSALKAREDVLINGLDGNRPDRPIASGFEQAHRIGRIGLIARHVGLDRVRREQQDSMSAPIGRARPEMGRATRLPSRRSPAPPQPGTDRTVGGRVGGAARPRLPDARRPPRTRTSPSRQQSL
jgi:hypothetical protein